MHFEILSIKQVSHPYITNICHISKFYLGKIHKHNSCKYLEEHASQCSQKDYLNYKNKLDPNTKILNIEIILAYAIILL